MMDQLFHLCHHVRFRRIHVFPVRDIDRSAGEFVDHLPQDSDALPHLLDPHQVTIVTIARAADHYVEIVVVVIQVGMFTPQVVLDAAPTQVRPRKGVRNRAIL